jgi:hypothetical protein
MRLRSRGADADHGPEPPARIKTASGIRIQYGRSRTRAFRQSFLMSYAIRIGERLAWATGDAERQVAAEAPGRNLLPVLAARHQAVDDAVDEMFGDSVSYHRTGRVSDSEGWYSGRAAADTATLHGHHEVTDADVTVAAAQFGRDIASLFFPHHAPYRAGYAKVCTAAPAAAAAFSAAGGGAHPGSRRLVRCLPAGLWRP